MPQIHFSDIGTINTEDVESYEVLEATEPGEAGSVSGKKDTVVLHLSDGSTKETHDPLGIKLLEEAAVSRRT